MKFTTALLAIATLCNQVQATASDPGGASWHLDNLYHLATERLDPVVSPNAVASHLHRIVGSSNFGANYNYDQYSKSGCTTAAVQVDNSNYWMPQLFWRENGTYTPLKAGHRFYYFLKRNAADIPVKPFPKGLRILAGNPNAKSTDDTNAMLGFVCLKDHFVTPSGDKKGPDFNFVTDCPQGLVTTVRFPPCWDGKNLYKSDGSHMSYTDNGVVGVCPMSHPVRLPSIMLEYTWQTYSYRPGVPLAGKLVWANGDTTGYGLHADFVNGWDIDVLDEALNNADCLRAEMTVASCPVLARYMNINAAVACQPARGELETYDDEVPLKSLPGCNVPWSTGSKPTNCTSNSVPNIPPALKGTDGSLVYTGPSAPVNQDPPNTWTRKSCLGGTTMLQNSFQYADTAMTVAKCNAACAEWGMPYSGLLAGSYCQCGTAIAPTAFNYADTACQQACSGDAKDTCGGNGRLEVFHNPSITKINHPGVSDPQYIGCRRQGTSSAALTDFTTIYQGMTVEYCKTYCGHQGKDLASIFAGRTCTCGDSFASGGTPVPQSFCNTPCPGNSKEFCGSGGVGISVFNLTLPGGAGSASPSAVTSVITSAVTHVSTKLPASSTISHAPSGAVTVTKTVTVTAACQTRANKRHRSHRDFSLFI
ncbi:hypothetical protein IAU60_001066 [Kwoniella sp. DSM 27419]